MRIKRFLINCLKGFLIGISVMIPGLSGGTMAVLLGNYEEILTAIVNLKANFRKSVKYLMQILIGTVCGIFVIIAPIRAFCDVYPVHSKYIFCAISIGSIYFFAKKSLTKSCYHKKVIYALMGVSLSLLISFIIHTNSFNINYSFEVLFLIGFPLALALVLPGISFSYMMYFLGIYEAALDALKGVELSFLLPLLMGIFLGTLIFSKLLLNSINSHPQETYSLVLGFVISSIIDIFL